MHDLLCLRAWHLINLSFTKKETKKKGKKKKESNVTQPISVTNMISKTLI